MATAVADALRGRGVGDPAAILTAEAGVTVFKVAFARWIEDSDDADLATLMQQTLDELRSVTQSPQA
jgi:hypothetical protein